MLAAVAAVAALFTAAWFLMVKPAVTSAATTAAGSVASSVAQQQASGYAPAGAASSLGHQGSPTAGGPASGSAPKTPTPSGTTTPTPTTASATSSSAAKPSTTSPSAGAPSTTGATPTTPKAPTTSTANYDTSLAVQVKPGQSGTATFTTPAHGTFMITDYVLENPQGDYGTITVTVNGTQVSMLALEDFRDDDYPWVTPLAVPAGAHVTITVSCAAPGTPPHGTPPTTCSESGLFNGTMTTINR